jgi:phospholipase/carboxylesterase
VAPTSRDDTWSLQGPDLDTANLNAIVDHVRGLWSVDETRVLLTGMSDGATFSWVSALQGGSPFTHLAPISGTFHPLLLEVAEPGRLAGLPVYLVHGALDWMFPVEVAREAGDSLTAVGARVTYSEIPDLSHTYPREENDRILSWLEAST